MKKMTVDATLPKNEKKGIKEEKKASVTVNYGDTALETIKLFGDEAVNTNAFANWRVTIQAGIRRALEKGKSAAEIALSFKDAKMGVATTTGAADPVEAAAAKFLTMTPEEQSSYIKRLQASAKGK